MVFIIEPQRHRIFCRNLPLKPQRGEERQCKGSTQVYMQQKTSHELTIKTFKRPCSARALSFIPLRLQGSWNMEHFGRKCNCPGLFGVSDASCSFPPRHELRWSWRASGRRDLWQTPSEGWQPPRTVQWLCLWHLSWSWWWRSCTEYGRIHFSLAFFGKCRRQITCRACWLERRPCFQCLNFKQFWRNTVHEWRSICPGVSKKINRCDRTFQRLIYALAHSSRRSGVSFSLQTTNDCSWKRIQKSVHDFELDSTT